jgi:hypothetical protein
MCSLLNYHYSGSLHQKNIIAGFGIRRIRPFSTTVFDDNDFRSTALTDRTLNNAEGTSLHEKSEMMSEYYLPLTFLTFKTYRVYQKECQDFRHL